MVQVNISWNEPADRGAKVGGPSVPLLGYDLIMATIPGLPSENGSPPALSANRLQFTLLDSQKKTEFRILENLAKGTTYYVYIRARNTAYINSGNSDWSDGMHPLLFKYSFLSCFCPADLLKYHRRPDKLC